MNIKEKDAPIKRISLVFNKVDNELQQPLYRQVQEAIREAIVDRSLRPDDALPAERELSSAFGVSRITIRKAIEGLVTKVCSTRIMDPEPLSGQRWKRILPS